jgi:predicted site-specific integrase-resolvase
VKSKRHTREPARPLDAVGNQEASKIFGVSSATMRVWARTGLVPVAFSLPNGQRIFDRATIKRLARRRRRHAATRVIDNREHGSVS